MRSPCYKTKNRAFIAADHVPERSRRAAVKMCQHCPIRRQCARDALTGGTSLDGNMVAPATGVISAGIHCRGDDATAQALADIAEVAVPPYRQQRKRPRAPKQCVSCGAGMVPWTRYEVPEGKVMAHARGHCVNCRSAYRATLDAEREASGKTAGLRKPAPMRRLSRVPDHCQDCEHPMLPASHPKREGFVLHEGRGLCRSCYARDRRAQRKARDAA